MREPKRAYEGIFEDCERWDKTKLRCSKWNCKKQDMNGRCHTCIQYKKSKL